MKKILIISMSMLMLVSCSSPLSLLFDNGLSPSSKMGHKITAAIGRKLEAKYGVQYMGISEKGTRDHYEMIGLELSYHRILSKDEARWLLVNCALDAINAYNSYPQFRKYMANYPFNWDNIHINIYILPNGCEVYHPNISVFSFHHSKLEYLTNDPLNKYKYFSEEEETLQEAMRIVSLQQSNSPNPE